MPENALHPFAYAGPARADSPVSRPLCLADLPLHAAARVLGVRPGADSREARELALRLLEIGFVEGERVRVIAQGHPGREPIAVRVGGTTFALRRFEAEQVLVAPGAADAPPA
jgi:ferrous iron transport protein A